jgi:hypothetical protein
MAPNPHERMTRGGKVTKDTRGIVRLPGVCVWNRCRTDPSHKAHLRFSGIALPVLLLLSLVLLSGCTQKAQGRIAGAYQGVGVGGGLVQMYAKVQLDDGTEVDALLPNSPPWTETQKVWDKVSDSVRGRTRLRVEIQRKGSNEPWKFVRFVDDRSVLEGK